MTVCGRIPADYCQEAIDLVRAQVPREVAEAIAIVVDDTCPPTVLCDRQWPFDALVVVVPVNGVIADVVVFEVTGRVGPELARRYDGDVPAHFAPLLQLVLTSG